MSIVFVVPVRIAVHGKYIATSPIQQVMALAMYPHTTTLYTPSSNLSLASRPPPSLPPMIKIGRIRSLPRWIKLFLHYPNLNQTASSQQKFSFLLRMIHIPRLISTLPTETSLLLPETPSAFSLPPPLPLS